MAAKSQTPKRVGGGGGNRTGQGRGGSNKGKGRDIVRKTDEPENKEEQTMGCGCEEKTLEQVINRAKKAIEQSKKLSTKDRKKLKSSTFCGPNRSFPVPDCKHVGVAKAYLGRSNFSAATKKKIAACINSKAKSLGCTPGKKAKAGVEDEDFYPKYIELSQEQKQIYSSDIFESTRTLVEDSIKNPGLELFEEETEE